MVVPRSLEKLIARWFKPQISDLELVIEQANHLGAANYVAHLRVSYNGVSFASSGAHPRLGVSLVKASVELGEGLICEELGRLDRCGLAGGFSSKLAIERARSELLERDAFLYHYRGNRPFHTIEASQVDGDEKIKFFLLSSKQPEHHIVLATDDGAVNGSGGCFLFGMGCSSKLKDAVSKATSEYSTIAFFHERWPTDCSQDFARLESMQAVERHHPSSRDPRNKERVSELCRPALPKTRATSRGEEFDTQAWKVKELMSPLRFVRYFEAGHDQLEKLTFGFPETWAEGDKALYHPFF